ncbi:hypothetical protein J6590_101853, partial [Homalodisca vitripennis]
KKRVQTYPKAACGLVQALSQQRMQDSSTSHDYGKHNHTSRQQGLKNTDMNCFGKLGGYANSNNHLFNLWATQEN